ncbi:cytochrome c-550 PedF [Primorskyibacter flagellatus]|uniref:cytochrome c-550 PedF n=1 Tax=Primorskyibacter flagellatus TaxID=1387277 RepID=UPI003A942BE6
MPNTLVRLASILALLAPQMALSHGDAAPQAVDTTGLPDLPEEMAPENPWRTAEGDLMVTAVEIGAKGFNSNCARCHGLEAISGGLAPDLRYLEADDWGDEWYLSRVLDGYEQNGAVKMPPFADILSQEAIWAIRTYIETRPDDQELAARQDELHTLKAQVDGLKDDASGAEAVAELLIDVGSSFEALSGAPKSVTALEEAALLLRSDPPRVKAASDALLGILRD